MSESHIESLGRLIARDRLAAGMSMGDLAAATGLSKSTVHRIENDTLENRPSPESLSRLARALGTEVEDYFALAGYVTSGGLPGIGPYLRTKYDASDEVAAQVEDYFRWLQSKEENADSTR